MAPEKFNRRLATSDAVGIPLKEAFVEMQFQANRRSSEIYSVVLWMHDMALQDAAAGAGGAIAGFDVRRIFLGDCSLSSAVDANIRGFKPEDVDPATDDANVASSRLLGGGQAGSVYLVTMKNGAEYVFKPELEGRLGLDHLVLAQGGAFADAQTTAQLNLATQDTANASEYLIRMCPSFFCRDFFNTVLPK